MLGGEEMTYEEKHDKLNRLVAKIEGTMLYWQMVKEPMPSTVVNKLLKMIEDNTKEYSK